MTKFILNKGMYYRVNDKILQSIVSDTIEADIYFFYYIKNGKIERELVSANDIEELSEAEYPWYYL